MLDELLVWLEGLLTPQGDVIGLSVQAGLFALVLLLTPALYRFVGRYFDRLMGRLMAYERIAGMPAAAEEFQTVRQLLRPLLAWSLAQIGVVLLNQIGQPSSLLAWLSGFLMLWLLYRFAAALLTLWLPLETAATWTRRVIRPVILVLALVHASGLLDEFLNLGFTVQTARITLGAVLAGIAVFLLGWVVSRATRSYLQNSFLPSAGMDESLSAVLATLASYLLLVAGLLAALTVAGFDLTALTVVLGGLSVGLAFGLQDIIANFFSGFVLLFERSIGHGDVIQIEDELGVVQDVGIRATVVRTIKDVEIIVPNSNLLSDVVMNYSRGENRTIRLEIQLFTYYERNPRQVREAMLAACDKVDGISNDPPPYVEFQGFGIDRTNEFMLEVWINDIWEFDEISSELRFYIWDELEARGLNFPLRQQAIYLQQPESGPEPGAPA